MVEIEFCGCQQRVGYLRFVPIIMSLGVSHATLFHERAFGVLGSLERWCFLGPVSSYIRPVEIITRVHF